MHRTRFLILSLLAVGCTPIGAQHKPKLSNIHYRLGVHELYQRRASNAVKEIEKALKFDPSNSDAHYVMAFLLQGQRRYRQAVHHLKLAIANRPKFSDAYNNLGTIYLAQERYDEAIPLFRKALSDMTYATPYLAYGNLGWAYYKKRQLRKAVKNIKTAIFHNRKFCQGHNNLGIVYAEMGNHASARKHLEKALKLCPKYVEAHYRLGLAHLKVKRRRRALASFRSCESLAPESELGQQCGRYLKMLH